MVDVVYVKNNIVRTDVANEANRAALVCALKEHLNEDSVCNDDLRLVNEVGTGVLTTVRRDEGHVWHVKGMLLVVNSYQGNVILRNNNYTWDISEDCRDWIKASLELCRSSASMDNLGLADDYLVLFDQGEFGSFSRFINDHKGLGKSGANVKLDVSWCPDKKKLSICIKTTRVILPMEHLHTQYNEESMLSGCHHGAWQPPYTKDADEEDEEKISRMEREVLDVSVFLD